MFAHALDYAARGLPVFPCGEKGKAPLVKKCFKAATKEARFAFADLKNISSNEIGPRQRVIGSKPHRQERNPPQEGIIRRTLVIAPPSVWFSAHI
jgi:Bifunctional DNA primase/polymerase, N-terminal